MKYLKNQSAIILSILVSLAIVFISCESDNEASLLQQNNFAENWGISVKKDFMGKVVDETNKPISGVDIKIGQETAITDANGIFIIDAASVYNRFAYITAEKAGYLKGSRSLVPTDGTNQVQIMLLDQNVVGTVSSGSEGEVNLPNGTTVKFDGAFKDANGNDYTGDVTVMMQHLASSDTDIDKKMPGMLYAQNANNEERVLETYGMVNVELQGTGGQKLNIADGHKARIEFPIDPAQINNAPNTIELWYFNEEAGVWLEEGSAKKEGNKYVAEVSHFSWWNCDVPFPTIKICIRIEDANGNSIVGVKVELWRDGATFPAEGWSGENGEMCGFIPKNEALTMVVYDACGEKVYTSSIGPFSTDTNLGTITISEIKTSTVTGTLLDCDNNPVTNGYVVLNSSGNQELTYKVTDGDFSFTAMSCDDYFTLKGVDYTSLQSTGIISNTFASPSANTRNIRNVGSMLTCDSVDDYVIHQIDNNPRVVSTNNVLSLNLYNDGDVTFTAWGSGDEQLDHRITIHVIKTDMMAGTYIISLLYIEHIPEKPPYPIIESQFIISNYPATIGEYLDATFAATYTDTTDVVRNITGTVHVKRIE